MCVCDRIIVKMKVYWLLFWVFNDMVGECFDRFGDIKYIKDSDDIVMGDERGCDFYEGG